MKSAIIYTRVSTARQAADDLPLAGQLDRCKAKAAELGADVLAVFSDPGISGREEFRPGFQEAIAYCEEHQVDFFVTWSGSRFARDHIVAGMYKRRLQKRGTQLISCTMDVDSSTPGGFVLDAVLAVFDEHYSRAISADTKRSMMKNARDGYWNGGCTPFGYRSVPSPKNPRRRALELVPEEAWLVTQIFQWRAAGVGVRAIAGRLTAAGYKIRGRRWNASTVHFQLRNPVVNGFVCFGKNSAEGARPRSEWLMVKSHQPIVPDDLWTQVQALLEAAAPNIGGAARSTHLFTGILKCHCGAGMHMETAKSGKYSYYNCGGWLKARACRSQRRRADELDAWLLDVVLNKVFTPEILTEVAAELNSECGTWARDRREQIRRIEAQLADTNRRRSKIFEVLELHGREAPNLGDLSERLQGLNRTSKALGTQLAELDAQSTPAFAAGDLELASLRALLNDIVRDQSDVQRSRALLGRLLESVVLHSDRAEIVYKTALLADQGKQAAVPIAGKWLPALNALGTRRLVFALPERLRKAA